MRYSLPAAPAHRRAHRRPPAGCRPRGRAARRPLGHPRDRRGSCRGDHRQGRASWVKIPPTTGRRACVRRPQPDRRDHPPGGVQGGKGVHAEAARVLLDNIDTTFALCAPACGTTSARSSSSAPEPSTPTRQDCRSRRNPPRASTCPTRTPIPAHQRRRARRHGVDRPRAERHLSPVLRPRGAHPSGFIGEDPAGSRRPDAVRRPGHSRRARADRRLRRPTTTSPDGTALRDYIHVVDLTEDM